MTRKDRRLLRRRQQALHGTRPHFWCEDCGPCVVDEDGFCVDCGGETVRVGIDGEAQP